MISRALILVLALLLGLTLMSGCSDSDSERLVCEVQSVNGGLPLISGYVNVGTDGLTPTEDDFYPIDIVPVVFYARPYGTTVTLPEDGPYSWFHVTSYDLTWIPGDVAAAQLVDHNVVGAFCDAMVPVNEDATINVIIADRTLKDAAWFLPALSSTASGTFTAQAQLTFYGHESGSEREVAIPAGLSVNFLPAVVDN